MNELRRLACLVMGAVALLAVGCGDDDDDAPIPIEELPTHVAGVYCDSLLPCLGDLQEIFLNGADCETTFASQFEDQELPRWQAAIEAGTLVYHADRVQACLDAFADAGCDIPAARTPEACEDALEGTVAVGADCNATVECVGRASCVFEQQCPGTCTALLAEGDVCDTSDNCEDGLSCRVGTCEAPAGEGEACEGADDPGCTLGMLCLGADGDTPGTCQPIDEVLTAGDGDTCDPLAGGPLCITGLSCILDSAPPLVWLCAGEVGSGAACKAGFPDQCPDDEICDADPAGGQIEGTCVSLPDAGEPCVETTIGAGCAPGLACVEDTCTQIGRIGEPCEADDGCYSDTCDGDTCTAPSACAFNG